MKLLITAKQHKSFHNKTELDVKTAGHIETLAENAITRFKAIEYRAQEMGISIESTLVPGREGYKLQRKIGLDYFAGGMEGCTMENLVSGLSGKSLSGRPLSVFVLRRAIAKSTRLHAFISAVASAAAEHARCDDDELATEMYRRCLLDDITPVS